MEQTVQICFGVTIGRVAERSERVLFLESPFAA
jgi:hypothetical protein